MSDKNFMSYGDAESLFTEIGSELGKRVEQYSTMPSASSTLLNKIVQYIGTTSESYINGLFYKCVYNEDAADYEWIKIDMGGGSGIAITATLLASGWDANNQQTIVFNGYSSSMNGVIGVPTSATSAQKTAYAEAIINVINQVENSFTFEAVNVPSIDLPVVVYAGGGSGSGGTTVIANPEGAATANLSKLQVDDTIYQIVGGGSGGSFQRETIYSATAQADTYTLSSPLTDFDAIEVLVKGGTDTMYRASGFFTIDELMAEEGNTNARFAITTDYWYSYFSVIDENTLARHDTGNLWVYAIVGLKFGAGSRSGFEQTVLWDYEADNEGSVLFGLATATLHDAVENYDAILIDVVSVSSDMTDATWKSTFQFHIDVKALSESFNPNYILCESAANRTSRYYIQGTTLQKTSQATDNTNGLVRVYGLKFGSGSNGAFTDEVIFENTGSTNPNTVTLNNAYTEYDEIVIKYTRPSNEGDYTWHRVYLVEALPVNSKIELTGWQPEAQYLHYTFTDEITLTIYNQNGGVIIREIHGLKFGTGAIDTAMSDTSKNAVQNKVIKKYIDDEIAEFVDLTTSDIDDIIADVFGS